MSKIQQITTDALSNANLNLIIPYKIINVFYGNYSQSSRDAYHE